MNKLYVSENITSSGTTNLILFQVGLGLKVYEDEEGCYIDENKFEEVMGNIIDNLKDNKLIQLLDSLGIYIDIKYELDKTIFF